MTTQTLDLVIRVAAEDDASPAEQDQLAVQLHAALEELEIESVQPAGTAQVPEDARAVELGAVGAFLVKVGPGAVASVVRGVRSFIQRSATRTVELEIDGNRLKLDKASPAEQERLIERFLQVVGSRGPSAA
jgi:hypothetical protein